MQLSHSTNVSKDSSLPWVGVGSEDRGFTGSVGASPEKALV